MKSRSRLTFLILGWIFILIGILAIIFYKGESDFPIAIIPIIVAFILLAIPVFFGQNRVE